MLCFWKWARYKQPGGTREAQSPEGPGWGASATSAGSCPSLPGEGLPEPGDQVGVRRERSNMAGREESGFEGGLIRAPIRLHVCECGRVPCLSERLMLSPVKGIKQSTAQDCHADST